MGNQETLLVTTAMLYNNLIKEQHTHIVNHLSFPTNGGLLIGISEPIFIMKFIGYHSS